MHIELQSLTTCDVAPDGNSIVFGFTDASGVPAQMRLSLNDVGLLAALLPDLIAKALQSRYGDRTLRYAYPIASWTVEQSSDPGTGMVTLSTTDGFRVCFSMPLELQYKLGEALASASSNRAQIVAN
jgi:hypothetical protein